MGKYYVFYIRNLSILRYRGMAVFIFVQNGGSLESSMDPIRILFFDFEHSFPELHTLLSIFSAGITKHSPFGAHQSCCLIGCRSCLQILPATLPSSGIAAAIAAVLCGSGKQEIENSNFSNFRILSVLLYYQYYYMDWMI